VADALPVRVTMVVPKAQNAARDMGALGAHPTRTVR